MKRWARGILIAVAALLVLWLILEIGLRLVVELPLKTDFYSSITHENVASLQHQAGIKASGGPGWIHLGWIADPDKETYRIEKRTDEKWDSVGTTSFGSFLSRKGGGSYRVWAVSHAGMPERLLGEVDVAAEDWQAGAI
jgi:hypothetical protein